jgi:hypothetical protein
VLHHRQPGFDRATIADCIQARNKATTDDADNTDQNKVNFCLILQISGISVISVISGAECFLAKEETWQMPRQ